jgi:hypothetical protein
VLVLPFFCFVFNILAQSTFSLLPCGSDSTTPVGQNTLPENHVFVCTDPNAIKYIRVAYHFFLPETKINRTYAACGTSVTITNHSGNFTETGDGLGNAYNGYKRAEDIIKGANEVLNNNNPAARRANDPNVQNPPLLNVTYPSTPPEIKHRLLLTGVYFHRNNDAYYSMDFPDLHDNYAVNAENTINVYDTGERWFQGAVIDVGGSRKYTIFNSYGIYVVPFCRDWSLIAFSGLLNHEIGHLLGLDHTWDQNDYCDDTPRGFKYLNPNNSCDTSNANCWSLDVNKPSCTGPKPCDDWSKVTNNYMDYGSLPPSLTTCQIARTVADLSGAGNKFIHSCGGCMPAIAFFDIKPTYKTCLNKFGVPFAYFLNGKASFNENRWRVRICEIDPTSPDVCLGDDYITNWNTGEISEFNLSSFYSFQANKHYKVTLTVYNTNCGENSSYSRVISTLPCTPLPPPVGGSSSRAAVSPISFTVTNPVDNELQVFYTLQTEGTVEIKVQNTLTGVRTVLQNSSLVRAGEHQVLRNIANLQSGSYALQILFNNQIYSKIFLKL